MTPDLTDDDIRSLLDAATEGPWNAERDLPYNRMPRVHSDADRSLICECGNVGTTQDQWEANARLIAAAPDLAAELLSLRERVRALEAGLTAAARAVLLERKRQVSEEGWTTDHDDTHDGGELAKAAACYAALAHHDWAAGVPAEWPWADEWWKPTTARADLVKAAALLLAEIERLDRSDSPPKEGE